MWHLDFIHCVSCGNADSPFVSKGQCARCYSKQTESRHKPVKAKAKYGASALGLTAEYLKREYVEEGKSLADISKQANCSRQYVHKRLKEFGIPLRNLSQARCLALEKDKLVFSKESLEGKARVVRLRKTHYNEEFFKNWTPEMAWVLGVLYTDGYLVGGHNRSFGAGGYIEWRRLGLGQKEPELLEKVLACMKCDAKIRFMERRETASGTAGALYYFDISAGPIWEDLHNLGLHQAKSLSLTFPTIPGEMMRHFLRGCWDGDGTIYREISGRYGAGFVSGSRAFIDGIYRHLNSKGIFSYGPYVRSTTKNPCYDIKVFRHYLPILYRYLYDDVPESIRLERKAVKFKEAAEFIEARLKHLAAVRAARIR